MHHYNISVAAAAACTQDIPEEPVCPNIKSISAALLVSTHAPPPASAALCFFKYGRSLLGDQSGARSVMSFWEAESMAFSNKENNAVTLPRPRRANLIHNMGVFHVEDAYW